MNKKNLNHWIRKFHNALRGVRLGIVGQSSFAVHLPATCVVAGAAWWLHCELWRWAVLGLCIGLVLCLELMNSALESLAHAICHEHNQQVGNALDIASGAVLLGSLIAAVIGIALLVERWLAVSI